MNDLKADVVYKNFWRNDDRFASLFNGVVFGGKNIIDPESLQEMDTDVSGIVELKDHPESVKRARDVIKKTAYGVDFVILGLENQQRTHYGMPLRVMIYDALGYLKEYREIAGANRSNKNSAQVIGKMTDKEFLSGLRKDDRFHPIISLVLSYQDEPWDGPRCLKDMMVDMPEEVSKVFSDYRMNLMEVRDSSKYHFSNEDVQTVFEISSNILNGKFDRIHNKYKGMDITAELAVVIGKITESEEIIRQALDREKGGMVNMCKSLEQLEQRCIQQGLQQGLQRGINQRNREIAIKMLRKGKDKTEVAEMTELTMEEVAALETSLKEN